MKISKIRVPFLRFLINWSLLLGGLYLTLTGIYLEAEQTNLRTRSFQNNEFFLVRVEYENMGRIESYLVHTENFEDHYLLGAITDQEVMSPNNEYIVFTDNNRLRITNTLTTDISTITLPQNITLEPYIPNPVWSQDSRWIVLLDDHTSSICSANLIIVNAIELESHNLGRIRPCENSTGLSEDEGIVWSDDNQDVGLYFRNGEYLSIFAGDITDNTSIIDNNEEVVTPTDPIQFFQSDLPELETSLLGENNNLGNIIVGLIAILLAFGISYQNSWKYWKREYMRQVSNKQKIIN